MINGNSFSYGVEIEGVFSKKLLTDLQLKFFDKVKLKTDGSVRSSNIYTKNLLDSSKMDGRTSEINVGIFTKQTEMFKMLEMVKSNKYHYFDESCGLHLHIKPKTKIEATQSKIIDIVFIRKLQKFAYTNLCEHIKARRVNTFCKPYGTLKNAKHDFSREVKYKFFRLHPAYDTFEFRFLSPCQHKCENIKTFLDYFVKELNQVSSSVKRKTKIINIEKSSNLVYNYKVNLQERIDKVFDFKVNKRQKLMRGHRGESFSDKFFKVYEDIYKAPRRHTSLCRCGVCVVRRINESTI